MKDNSPQNGSWRRLMSSSLTPMTPLEGFTRDGERRTVAYHAAVLAMLGLVLLLPGWGVVIRSVGVLTCACGLVWTALVYFWLIPRDYRWLGYANSAVNVSLVSAAMAGIMVLGRPEVVVSSKVLVEVYLFLILASSWRYEWKICFMAGALALLQYAALVVYAQYAWDLSVIRDPAYGVFSWAILAAKLLILTVFTGGVIAMLLRARYFWEKSSTDALTGLFNRGFFDERAAQEFERTVRYRRPLSIVMIDIDFFKIFNDQHGHVLGDYVLQLVARQLLSRTRSSDIVARYGGEEFVLLLPETSEREAMHCMEQLRKAISKEILVTPAGPSNVTVSAGVVEYSSDHSGIAELVRVADQRLYRAKDLGRNQVVGSEQPVLTSVDISAR